MVGAVTFSYFEEVRSSYPAMLLGLAEQEGATAVAELGGGARPVLADEGAWSFVPTRVVYDIDPAELAEAGDRLETRQADLCEPVEREAGRYDLVFSRMLCEHLRDPETFHRNCLHLLRPGGVAAHLFPTLYALPFVVNRIVPEQAARRAIRVAQPGRLDDPKTKKFPAYYRWCRGPTARSMRRFESAGFDLEEWRAGFGHCYYQRFGPLQALEDAKAHLLVRHPVPQLTSFSVAVLRKPG